MSQSSVKKRNVFFIKGVDGPNEEAINMGFRWLLENAEENRKGMFIAVPSASSLKEEKIRSTLGETGYVALKKNGKMNFNRAFVRLVTVHNSSSLWNIERSVVLALYPNLELLRILDSCPTVSSILVVPDHFSVLKDWISKWNAIELYSV